MQTILAFWVNLLQPVFYTFLKITGLQTNLNLSPRSCLHTSPTLTALVSCLDTFTVPHAFYDAATYNLAQPVANQRRDWGLAVASLLSVDGDCSTTSVPHSLQGLYAIEPFGNFCVLYEVTSRCGTYLKGWGFMIVPSSRSRTSRDLHISAPHPGYDLGTVQQAAHIFESTGSRSLLVTGRTRTAYLDNSNCILPVSPTQDYYRTDPAHNDEEPFFDASVAIYQWQHRKSGCSPSSCSFLQLHGKGSLKCPSDHIFLSSGIGNSSSSKAWYTDDIDRPIKRLQRTLKQSFPSWRVSLPSDSNCPLTATKNVVGRHINGIHIPRVCNRAATSKTATGEFLHAEQASLSRNPTNYDSWSRAVLEAFDASCADGMVVDSMTKLCVPLTLREEGRSGCFRTQNGHNTNLVDRTYVANVADAHVLAADRLNSYARSLVAGEVFFITNDEPMRFWDFWNGIWDRFDKICLEKTKDFEKTSCNVRVVGNLQMMGSLSSNAEAVKHRITVKECQKAAWPRHKPTCQGIRGLKSVATSSINDRHNMLRAYCMKQRPLMMCYGILGLDLHRNIERWENEVFHILVRPSPGASLLRPEKAFLAIDAKPRRMDELGGAHELGF
uniref:3-beta hydroxysteroid dehydrogenase/isomerase domain-containing protein n=1 Tax=Psilocybe cubensis TaxID=181762 RepID=A0A8H8CJZ2_PSICU